MAKALWEGSARRILAGALIALIFIGLHGSGGARPAEALTNCDVADLTYEEAEAAFLRLINDYRASKGKAPLTVSQNLNRAASWHAHSMATQNFFSHTDNAGRSAAKRSADCGSKGGIGENITAGTIRDTAQEAFDAWKASSGHNANMLNDSYKQIGIARYNNTGSTYQWYWVTVFSNADDGTRQGATVIDDNSSSSNEEELEAEKPTQEEQTSSAPQGPKATMTSPAAGAALTSTTVDFLWAYGTDAQAYYVYIGSSTGASNYLKAQFPATTNTVKVQGFPRTGATIYVRLYTLTSSGWQYNDYTYTLPR